MIQVNLLIPWIAFFLICILWCLTILRNHSSWEETACPRASQCLGDSKEPSQELVLDVQTNSEPDLLHQIIFPKGLNHPEPGTRHLEPLQPKAHQSYLNLPTINHSLCPAFPWEPSTKTVALMFSFHSSLLPADHLVLSLWPCSVCSVSCLNIINFVFPQAFPVSLLVAAPISKEYKTHPLIEKIQNIILSSVVMFK